MQLNSSAKAALDRSVRDFSSSFGAPFSDFIQQNILDQIAAGAIGITANSWDVDSLALDGGHFAKDADTTTGLTFGYKAGRIFNGKTVISVSAGTLLLSASNTNYVECSRSGTVSSNTSAFSTGAIPLYQITTGVSTISTVTNKKNFLFTVPNGGFTGDMFSTIQKTKVLQIPLGTISATTTFPPIVMPPAAGTIVNMRLASKDALAQSDSAYYTFSAVNKGPSGGGSTALLAATDANTTKLTGGSAIAAYVARQLTLTGTTANLNTAASDAIVFTATKTGSPTNLSDAVLIIELTHDN